MIRKFLDCSTAYLPPDLRRDLWLGVCPFTDIGEDQHHRWVYVDETTLSAEQLAEMPLPDAVQKILQYALGNECSVICFDPDGPDLEGDFTVFCDNDDKPRTTSLGSSGSR